MAATARFQHCVCPAPLSLPPSLSPVSACSTHGPHLLTPLPPWTVWTAHKPLSPLSFCILPLQLRGGCPYAILFVPVFRCFACLVHRTWSVMTRSPFLVYMSNPPSNLLRSCCGTSLEDIYSDGEVFIPDSQPRSPLVSCNSIYEVLIPRQSCILARGWSLSISRPFARHALHA
jgi:hypothetical protein